MPVPRFDHDVPMPKVPFREARKETPDRTVNAALPFLLALGAGFVTFVGVGLIAIGWELPIRWPLVVAGFVTLAVMVWWLLALARDQLLWTVETITGIDVNQDGVVGEPKRISIEVANPDNRSLKYLHLPVEEKALRQLCVGLIVQQRPFSEAEWTGRGRPFSRAQFRDIRARLLEANVITWKDARHKTQGVEFTAWGRTVMRRALESCVGTHEYAGAPESRLVYGQQGSERLLEEGDE